MIIRIFMFGLAMILAVSAQARSLSDAEETALAELVVRYAAAYQEKSYWVLGAAVPPRVLERYVAARGDPDLKRDLWVALFVSDSQEIDSQLGTVTESFTLDFHKARFREAPDGTPYVVLPSATVIVLKSGDRQKISAPYLALLDDGVWYLINVGFGVLMGSVEGLYPSFDEIEFDYATREQL